MQAAADTTALMKAQSAASLTSQNLQTQAGIYYQAMFTRTDAANPPEQALPAAAASQIVTTFNQIGSNLSKLHIAK